MSENDDFRVRLDRLEKALRRIEEFQRRNVVKQVAEAVGEQKQKEGKA